MSRPEIFFKCLLVVAIFSKPHCYDIPGLDYCHCQDCKQWIVTESGLQFLEKQLAKTMKKQHETEKGKKRAIKILQERIAQEKQQRQFCPGVPCEKFQEKAA